MKKVLLVLMLAFSFLLFACGEKYELKANKSLYEITEGESVTLDVTFTEGAPVTWSSSDPSVVTVLDGVATASKVGEAKITVAIKDTELKAEITVKVAAKEIVPTAVSITGETTVDAGKTLDFSAVVAPEGASQEVVWSVSDESVATIAADGKLTALKAGTVKVVATAKGTEVKAEVEVTVNLVYDYTKLVFGASFEGTEVEVDGVKYYVGETAFTNMNEALAKAADGAEIKVLAGVYAITELINVEKAVTFVGPNADKLANEDRVEEAYFTSDNYNTGSFVPNGKGITFNGIGFKGVGSQGYPIQAGAVLEDFTIKSCYFENVNTVLCSFATTEFKGTLSITNTVNKDSLQFLAWIDGTTAELTKFEFANNKVYGEVAEHYAGKGMISFRATDAVAEIVIENNEFALTDYVLASNPIYVASGKLSVKNNSFYGVEEANLFFEGTVAEKTVEGNKYIDNTKLLFGASFEGTEVEVDGVKYYVGVTAFTNMNEALAAASNYAEIKVLAGEYEITELIKVEKGVTFVGPNADKLATEDRVAEAYFTSSNYDTGSFVPNGKGITFNGIGFKGVGNQGYPIQAGAVLEDFTIKSCYFENVNTVLCAFATTEFKGTISITNTVNKDSLQFLAWIDGTTAELTKFDFANNKVYGEVAEHYAGKGMISFRATDAVAEIVIENNEFALTDYVLASNPIYVASGKLSVKNNKFAGVEEANLFFEGTVAEKTVEGNQFS